MAIPRRRLLLLLLLPPLSLKPPLLSWAMLPPDTVMPGSSSAPSAVPKRTHTYTYAHKYTYIHPRAHTRTHTYTHTYTNAHTHAHTQSHTHTHIHMHTHTNAHTCAHTVTHTHTHTLAGTRMTPALPAFSSATAARYAAGLSSTAAATDFSTPATFKVATAPADDGLRPASTAAAPAALRYMGR